MRKALLPFDTEKDKEKIDRYFIETESVAPNEVGPDRLANKDVVYLLNAAARTDPPPTNDRNANLCCFTYFFARISAPRRWCCETG